MKQVNSLKEYKSELVKKKILIHSIRILLLVSFFLLWELLSNYEIISSFLFSKPSAIWDLFINYLINGQLMYHVGISVYETLLGLIIGTVAGLIIASLLYLSPFAYKILDPFLVVFNAIPKTALAPILIIWIGTGVKGIVAVSISLSIVVTILSAYNYFIGVDPNKVKMLKTYGAKKWTILTRLIMPSNKTNIISIIKINIGMSWVGVIVGEFLVSRGGIGYLVVYGGQVFKLDLVMMGVLILGITAFLMYEIVNVIEKYSRTHEKKRRKSK